MPRSIRSSLLAGIAAGTLVIFAAAGWILDRGVRTTLIDELDGSLEAQARLLISTVDATPAGIDQEFDEMLAAPEPDLNTPRTHVQLRIAGGDMVYRSMELREAEAELPTPGGRSPAFVFTRHPAGQRLRVCAIRFRPPLDLEDVEWPPGTDPDLLQAPEVVISIARETAGIDALVARLRWLLVTVGAGAAALLLFALHGVVRRSLRPLDRLAGEISGLRDTTLANRVRLSGAPAEIEPVVTRLNELLGRLEDAFRRERTLSADIAHELRTPLAGLRTAIEVELSRPRDAAELEDTLRESLEIVRRMQAMIQTLLYLARLEAGQVTVHAKPLDLVDVAREVWAPLNHLAHERRLQVTHRMPESAPIVSDPTLIETALRNVFENAVHHADEGGYVTVEVETGSGNTVVSVANSGSRVSQETVPDLTERFTRGDAARASAGAHVGLGLALVKKVAGIMGVSTDIRAEVGGEFRVTLSGHGFMNNPG